MCLTVKLVQDLLTQNLTEENGQEVKEAAATKICQHLPTLKTLSSVLWDRTSNIQSPQNGHWAGKRSHLCFHSHKDKSFNLLYFYSSLITCTTPLAAQSSFQPRCKIPEVKVEFINRLWGDTGRERVKRGYGNRCKEGRIGGGLTKTEEAWEVL